MVFDNLNALCPSINKDAPPNLLETIKTERFTQILSEWIELQEVQIIGVARHFSLVNIKLFEVGLMDNLLEMQ